ncbi:aldehyde dehydrogenase family protein [Dyella telluris]|uniref:Aldehyde dehydrogenase family protein n=1 Tax=Dyella telluris TaxID=2763498 RepID=A0A7G8Q5B4_9GAMM|nr:aldehyde dehydrogenase family protein [Dyella telluris]QNK01972.1 aldehyde dehydrogenase family protein [Dyella telluris]
MLTLDTFYIDGRWASPAPGATLMDVIDPATEAPIGKLAMGGEADVDRAVSAARKALASWSQTSQAERIALLERIVDAYQARFDDLAEAVCTEMGCPLPLSHELQAAMGLAHFRLTLKALRSFAFEHAQEQTLLVREPIGVAALITPWNWPLNQIVAKLAPALAAGCTVVLKPSEVTPLSARLLADVLHDAGVPAGVFNMVFGLGPVVGTAMARHPDVAMISITGSTRAGIDVAVNSAPTVKRVTQELGGKSPFIVLDDAELPAAISAGVLTCMSNSGQTCVAPTRMLVPRATYQEATVIAANTAHALQVGPPRDPASKLGPIAHRAQYEHVQQMIDKGINEGARLIAGGPGRPASLARGFYARPTIFADVSNDMAIAREEIFGPVLVMIPYDTEEDAIAIANDTPYGLAGYVWSGDAARALRVARRIRAGAVQINAAHIDLSAPFGGYKASGNGREFGHEGIGEFLEWKSIPGGVM